MPTPEILLSAADFEKTINRLAEEISQKPISTPLVLVGLVSRGELIAQKLAEALARLGSLARLGKLDISLYRDDLHHRRVPPLLQSSDLPASVDGARVVVVDDVIFTGRTIRAALNALHDYGRPSCIELVALADRGGREMPIQPDYIGITYPVAQPHEIQLIFDEKSSTGTLFLVKNN